MAITDPENNYVGPDDGRRGRNNVLLILLLLLLLASIGFNVYQYTARQQKEKILNEELVSSTDLRKDLQNQLDSSRAALEEYKGRVSKLDTLISQREKELLAKADQINRLLGQNKISYNQYLRAKDQIEELKFWTDKYKGEIDRLSKENKELTVQNSNLKTEVKESKHTIDVLKDTNVLIGNKLKLAQKLKADNIEVTGVKFGKGNKERETNRASQLEKLKVCFTIASNSSAFVGRRDVFVQLLDPRGQTIAIDALGSGTTMVDGEQAQYTTKEQIEYNNDAQNYCMYWGKGSAFEPGKYTIRLFTEGYELGETSFNIK